MRRYDNYDYEEAFKKYIDDTEEERLEKLLKEGKVNCLTGMMGAKLELRLKESLMR